MLDWMVDGVYNVVELDEEGKGQAVFDLSHNGNGAFEYTATAKFIGDDDYNAVEATTDVIVTLPHDVTFDVEVQNITYGDDLVIKVTNVADVQGGLLTGIIIGYWQNDDGEYGDYEFAVTDGEGTGYISGLNAGKYSLTVKFTDEGEFYSETEYVDFEVDRADFMLAITVEDNNDVTVLLIGVRGFGLSEEVAIKIDGEYYKPGETETVDGVYEFENPVKTPGLHLIEAEFFGNENYYYDSAYISYTIPGSFVVTNITVSANNVSYGDKVTIDFTLVDIVGNPISGILNVTVADKEYTVEVGADGKGTLPIEETLTADTYAVVANYTGEGNYVPSTGANYFNVARNATQIIFENMETVAVDPKLDGKVGEYFYFTLKDANGLPIANTPMEIGFNGVVYTYEKDGICTDENGVAKLQINLGYKGDYTFAICYLGNQSYNASFVVAKISVSGQTPTITVPNKSYAASAKTKTLTAIFKNEHGKLLVDKWITFTVNGKTYKAKTNEKGVASVNGTLTTKGTYTVVAKWGGDSTYDAVNKTATLKIT